MEALIVSQESACKDLPMLLAASQNPENSLGLSDIQEIHHDAITATKSLGIAKDNWSKTKAMFSRKETLKFFDEKEAECTLRGVKMDAIEDNAVLDAWGLWCDQSIERINNVSFIKIILSDLLQFLMECHLLSIWCLDVYYVMYLVVVYTYLTPNYLE